MAGERRGKVLYLWVKSRKIILGPDHLKSSTDGGGNRVTVKDASVRLRDKVQPKSKAELGQQGVYTPIKAMKH